MADIMGNTAKKQNQAAKTTSAQKVSSDKAPKPSIDPILVEIAELLFFAYRDFTSNADADLHKLGFGRAHHRVLHFVYRNPGLRVADLLEILKITKQSLARVLKQLVDEGYVEQKEGQNDRRERLLFLTTKGSDFVEQLLAPQLQRISRGLQAISPDGEDLVHNFLYNMVGDNERLMVSRLLKASAARTKGGANNLGGKK